jgi:23S rRNA pseudouridine2604 synthase
MSDRPKISLKPQAPPRDPRRRPVRGRPAGAPPAKPPPRDRDDRRRGPPGGGDGPPARSERSRDERPRPAGPRPGPRPDPRRADAPRQDQRRNDGPRPAPPRPQPAPQRPGPLLPAPVVPHGQGLRISKLLTDRGVASRREADDWIAAGWVKVNGRMAVLGQRALPDAQIEIDPRARNEQVRSVTILLHKPIGYVSGQAEDGYEPASVLIKPETRWSGDSARQRWHPGQLRGLAPAGRLDIDSTGLLVLTQDGRIAKLLIGDQTRVEKEYLVRVAYRGDAPDGRLPEAQLERLRHGLELDGVALRPAHVSWSNEDQLRVVLREGRKRQIRRMCELVGLEVLALKRVRIGSIVLGPLPVGQWRYLDEHERFI